MRDRMSRSTRRAWSKKLTKNGQSILLFIQEKASPEFLALVFRTHTQLDLRGELIEGIREQNEKVQGTHPLSYKVKVLYRLSPSSNLARSSRRSPGTFSQLNTDYTVSWNQQSRTQIDSRVP